MVDVEANGGVGVDAEPLLDHPPNPHDGLVVSGVSQPHGQLVRPAPDVDHGTVDLKVSNISVQHGPEIKHDITWKAS